MVKTKSIRKFNLWILSAILFCGLTLTACSSASEDNPVSPTQKEVDKNADVDEFYKVAAVAGDPAAELTTTISISGTFIKAVRM